MKSGSLPSLVGAPCLTVPCLPAKGNIFGWSHWPCLSCACCVMVGYLSDSLASVCTVLVSEAFHCRLYSVLETLLSLHSSQVRIFPCFPQRKIPCRCSLKGGSSDMLPGSPNGLLCGPSRLFRFVSTRSCFTRSKSVNTVAFGAGKKPVVWGVGSENHVIRN